MPRQVQTSGHGQLLERNGLRILLARSVFSCTAHSPRHPRYEDCLGLHT